MTEERPWLGPESYTEAQSYLFYGRSEESEALLRLIERDRLVILFGASGLGKTSLLEAGLFPRLRQAKSRFLPVRVRIAHDDDTMALSAQILAALHAAAVAVEVEPPARRDGDVLWEHFHREGNLHWSKAQQVVTPVIVLDQFEEIFTLGQQTDARRQRSLALMTELADLIENRLPAKTQATLEGSDQHVVDAGFAPGEVPVKIVFSQREDFLAHLEAFRSILPSLLRSRLRLTAMTLEQAEAVVISEQSRNLLAEGIAKEILDFVSKSSSSGDSEQERERLIHAGIDAERPVDPALLSIFCYELNEARIKGNEQRINHELLAGSKQEILTGFYARVVADMSTGIRSFIEDDLVTPGGFRDSRALDDALAHAGVTKEALDLLVNRRLLRYTDRDGGRRVELSHDVLLGSVKHSGMRHRQTKARRRKLRRAAQLLGVSGVVVLAVIGSAKMLWSKHEAEQQFIQHEQEQVAYYNDFVRHRGQPVGTDALAFWQIPQRQTSFKIVKQGTKGPVLRVEAIGANLAPTPNHSVSNYLLSGPELERSVRRKPVRWEFSYTDAGLQAETAFDREDNMVWTFRYEEPVAKDAQRAVGQLEMARGLPSAQAGMHVAVDYTDEGWERRIAYLDWRRQPAPGPKGSLTEIALHSRGADGAYVIEVEHDVDGLPIRVAALDGELKPMHDSNGVHATELSLTKFGNIDEIRYFDEKNEPSWSRDGSSILRSQFDENGNQTSLSVFDEGGAKVRARGGLHRITWERNPAGRPRLMKFWDDLDQRTHDVEGCYGYQYEYEGFTDGATTTTCLDARDVPAVSRTGWATFEREYDDWGDIRAERYRDAAGALTFIDAGYQGISFERDSRGFEISRVFIAELDGVQDCSGLGYCRQTTTYDEDGVATERSYFDAEGKLAPTRQGYAREQWEHDALGHVIETRYFDTQGAPTLHAEGYASVFYLLDSFGQVVEEQYFDVDGARTRSRARAAAVRQERDASGRVTRTRYLGMDNRPALSSGGFAGWTWTYDRWGHILEATKLGLTGEPILDKDGIATHVSTYDRRGYEVVREFLDQRGKPAFYRGGYAGWRDTVDPYGGIERSEHFDAKGGRAVTLEGVGGWIARYDHHGHLLQQYYFDAADQPVTAAAGYAGESQQHDEHGRVTRTAFADIEGRLVSGIEGLAPVVLESYTPTGRPREKKLLDRESRPFQGMDGWHRVHHEYDTRGNNTETCYFDVHDQPVLHAAAYHCVVRTFSAELPPRSCTIDETGGSECATSIHYLNTDREPRVDRGGVYRLEREFDRRGLLVRQRAFGVESEPVNLPKVEYHMEVVAHDDAGLPIRYQYYGTNEAAVMPEGYHELRIERDRMGREALRSYHDVNGVNIAPKKYEYAKAVTRYTEDGRIAKVEYQNSAGEAVDSKEGYAQERYVYEWVPGGRIERLYVDTHDGKPATVGKRGWHMHETHYDMYDRETSTRFFGKDAERPVAIDGCEVFEKHYGSRGSLDLVSCLTDGKLAFSSALGYARLRQTHDDRGRLIKEETLGPKEELLEATIWEYDDDGNLIAVRAQGPKASSSCESREFDYDNHAKTREYCFGVKKGRVLVAEYGEFGDVTSRTWYASSATTRAELGALESLARAGDPTDPSLHRYEYSYDVLGRLIRITYLTKKLQPLAHCPAMVYSYDESGRQVNEGCQK